MMYSESDNNIAMIGNDTDATIQQVSDWLLRKYKEGLEQSMKVSNFIFYYVPGMHYICNKISFNRGRLYIDYPK